MKISPDIRRCLPLFVVAALFMQGAAAVWAGQGITGIKATYETRVYTNDNYATSGATGSGGAFDPALNYNITFNVTTQNNLRCDGFEVGTNEFSYILLADGIRLLRINNPTPATGSLHVILYEDNGYAGGTNIDLKASYVPTMEQSLLSVYVNRGSDNTFCNTGNGNGNNNNIERIDYIFLEGYPLHDNSSLRGFVVMDRGGNDQFQIAAITNLDANGNATGFGPPVVANTADWGWSGIQLNTLVLRGYTEGGDPQHPSANVDIQDLDGVYFTWQELGLNTGDVCYGYALIANDVALGANWTNPASFPLNTTEGASAGGLDLISGGSMFFDVRINGTVGDFVWNDYNGNGIQDAGEPGLPDVRVRVYDTNGVFAGITRTDTNGYYQVRGLATDTYYARFYLPTSTTYYFTSPNAAGTNDLIDSDADTNTGITASFYLLVGTTNNTIDAGMHFPPTDLAVAKTVSTNRPNQLDTIVYSIVVTNKGPETANLVQVTDVMPAGITFGTYGASQGSYTNTTGLWEVGTLASGAVARLTVTASVDALTAAWVITNTATITRIDRPDTWPADNTSSVPLTVKSIDLAVTKTVDQPAPATNDLVAYRIVLTNLGPDIATGVRLYDALPAGISYVSFGASSGSYNNVSGIWTVGTVAVSGSAALTITGRVDAGTGGQTLTNSVWVLGADQGDTNALNNTSSVPVTVVGADLAVTKSVNNAAPNEGGTIAYTIVLTNLGPNTATGVAVTDAVPAGVTYVSYGASSGSYNNVSGIWTVGTVAVSGSATLTITGTVNAGTAGTTITNRAAVSRSNQPDPVSTNNTGSVVIAVSGLRVTKTSDASPYAYPGSNITYTIVVSNSGATAHTGVNVADYAPSGTTFVAGSATVTVWQVTTNFTYTYTTTVVTRTVRDEFNAIAYTNQDGTTNWITDWQEGGEGDGVSAGAIRVVNQWSAYNLRILREVRSASRFADLGGFTNATFSFDYRRILMDPADTVRVYASSNGGTDWTQIGTINGPVGGASDAATLSSNHNLTPYIATNVGIRFDIPVRLGNGEGIAFDNVQIQFSRTDIGTNVTTNVVSGIVTNAGGVPPNLATNYVLDPGRVLTLTFQALVNNPVTLTAITNVVSVTSAQQSIPVVASVTNPVISTDVGVFKTVNNSSPWAGSNVVYTIVATNNGPGLATGLQITDVIAGGITYVGHDTTSGTYTPAGGLWDVGSLALGGSATLTITASVDAGTAGTSITNTAAITALNQADTNPSNNTSSAIITVVGADLGVAKEVDEAAPFVGNGIRFTLVVTNNGPSAATGVALTDLLPAGLTYVSNQPSQGSYASGSGIWTVGNVGVGGSASLWLYATVNTNTAGWVITNRVSITSRDQPDPVTANDSNSVTVAPQPQPLVIAKSSDGGGLVDVGDTITYTIVVSNISAVTQTAVTLADALPAGCAYVPSSTQVTAPADVSETVLDRFGARSYANNDGADAWMDDWTENENNGALSGNLLVEFDNVKGSTFTLRFSGSTNAIRRSADLGGSTNAVLSFEYRRVALSANEYVGVEVSSNGAAGPWVELARMEGPATDAAYAATNFTITPYATTNTAIRFITTNTTMAATDIVWIDDVQILYGRREPVTVAGGNPPGLAENYLLKAGESMTVTYQVTVDNPPAVWAVTNIASVTSTLMPEPRSAAVTDVVARADLAVTKTVNNQTPTVGALIEYTISLTNEGPHRARGVWVVDALPAGLHYSNHTVSAGSYSAVSGIWTVGTVAAYAGASLVIQARVTNDDAWAGITITNTALIQTPRTYELVYTNNTNSATLTPKPTLVVVTRVEGWSDGGASGVEWETALEVGTVGFNVYREDAQGGLVRVNGRLLPGLLVAEQGGVYRVADAGAQAGRTYNYWIEEVESGGRKTRYGPYTLTMKAGAKRLAAKSAGAAAYSRTAKSVSGEKAGRLLARSEDVDETKSLRLLAEGNMVKLGVKETGLKYVSRAELATVLNLPEVTVGQMLAGGALMLSRNGERVSYLPAGVDGRGMYFYGEELQSIYSDENVYWLGAGESGRSRSAWGGNPAPAAGQPTYRDTVTAEGNQYAVPAFFTDPEADIWMWEYLSAGWDGWDQKSFDVELEGVRPDHRTAVIKVKLMGGSKSGVANEHQVVVWVNGKEIGGGAWSGEEPYVVERVLDQSDLVEGANTVTVKALLGGDVPYSVVYVDKIEVNYARYYRAVNNQLRVRGDNHRVITISGFTQSRIAVADVGDPAKPKVLGGVRVDGGTGNWRVSFVPEDGKRDYVAFVPGALEQPVAVAAADVSGLTSGENRAAYLVITVDELRAAAEELAAYRAAQGYSTKVVTLEEIYDAFGYGVASPHAIKAFVDYAYHHWAEPPRYLVLAGDGTYDYKDYKGYGDNVVPPKVVNTPHGLFESDGWYGDVEGDDGVPEVLVGRLPVLTEEELLGLVDKIAAYEASSGTWAAAVAMVADNADEGGAFEDDVDALGGWIPGGYVKHRVYLSELGFAAARTQLATLWNGGLSLVNYLGHGGLDRLTAEGLLLSGDAAGLANEEKLPVVAAMTCAAGRYSLPGFDCLGEALLMKEGGGAVAVWAPTGLSMNELAKRLDEGYLKARYAEGETVLGEVIGSAMEGFGTNEEERYMLHIYNLLGDPALRVK